MSPKQNPIPGREINFSGACAAILLGASLMLSGCASQKDSAPDTGTQMTGSYLPQSVERNGPVTNGKNNVRVIDRSDLDGSGGGDLNQSLRQLGVTH